MEIMELVKELAKKDEKEHGLICFDEKLADFYRLSLEKSKLNDAYIHRSREIHFVGGNYEESMKKFCKVRDELSSQAKKTALVHGYPIMGIDSSEFYTGMDYSIVNDIIDMHYMNISINDSIYEAQKQRVFDKYRSRQAIRSMYDTEPVPYAVRRQQSDIAYLSEVCEQSADVNDCIAAFVEDAEVELEVFYENVSFDDRVIRHLVKTCQGIFLRDASTSQLRYENTDVSIDKNIGKNTDEYDEHACILKICSELAAHKEEDVRLFRQCLCMMYFRAMIDEGSDGARITVEEVINCIGGTEKLAAAVNTYQASRRSFRNDAEWENYRVRAVYERYLRKHSIKTNGPVNIRGYSEPIAEISNGNKQLIEYLWLKSKLPLERLYIKPYENGQIICYREGTAGRNNVLGFKELLSESLLVAANWFRLQGYDPVFCSNGLGYRMYYQYGLYAGMNCDECERVIAKCLGEREGDGNPDVRKYRPRIRRISSGYRFNHERFSDVSIEYASISVREATVRSSDRLDILNAFAEQYYLPELLRQADRIGKPLLDLINLCVLRYKLDPPEPESKVFGRRLAELFTFKKGSSDKNKHRHHEADESEYINQVGSIDSGVNEARLHENENNLKPYCFINKTTGTSMAVCLLFNYNSIGRADIVFPVPVVFGKAKDGSIAIITDYEDYFTGDNAVANFKEVTYNQFLKYTSWLGEYILLDN